MGEARGNGSNFVTFRVIAGWILPLAFTALLGVLTWIGQNIQDMSRSLAVVVSKIDEHERRLAVIEDQLRHPLQPH